jgi:hypothetical protein
MLRACNQLILRRSTTSLRDPGRRSKCSEAAPSEGTCGIFREQSVSPCANLPGFRRCFGFARHTRRGPSKSTERNTPYCFTCMS